MNKLSKFGAFLVLVSCAKGGAGGSLSTENGGSSGAGDGTASRNTGDTSGLSLEERKYWRDQEDYLFRSIDAGPKAAA